jgi:exodeoxyribonuclease V alpha subunit
VVLVGDPEQLASVEAGAVLGDIVGPAADQMLMPHSGAGNTGAPSVAHAIVMLRSNFRFSGPLAELASAIRRGDPDAALDVLASGDPAITWIDRDVTGAVHDAPAPPDIRPVREITVTAGRALFEAAVTGDGSAALEALSTFRLLCAHRRGAGGVEVWTSLVEGWLAEAVEGFDPDPDWYPGRPVMVTANDYSLRLFNGDTGAVVRRADGGLDVVFPRVDGSISVSPSRLSAVETVFATTVHKSQGSEFDNAALVLPDPDSPLLTRELLYTAVTRAKRTLTVVGPEESLRVAVSRPIARASGLTARLWE